MPVTLEFSQEELGFSSLLVFDFELGCRERERECGIFGEEL